MGQTSGTNPESNWPAELRARKGELEAREGEVKTLGRVMLIWDRMSIVHEAYYNAIQRLNIQRQRRLVAMTELLGFAARYLRFLPPEAMVEVRAISKALLDGTSLEAEIVGDLLDVVTRETTLPEEATK